MRLPPHRESRLANGVRLAQIDWPGAPFIEFRIVLPMFRHSAQEAASAQLLARLLPLGPDDRSQGAFAERLLQQGSTANSFSSVDRISLSLTVPEEKHAQVLADLLSRLEAPAFSSDAARDVVRSEVTRARQQAAFVRELELSALTATKRWGAGHPYTFASTTADELMAVDLDGLAEAAQHRLTMNGAAVMVVGDFATDGGRDWSKAQEIAEEIASVSTAGSTGPLPVDPGPRGGASETVPTSASGPTASLRIHSPAPPRQHPDHPAAHLFSMCLGGYFGSRLVQELRERRGDVYGVTAGFEVLATAATQALVLECPADRIDSVREEVLSTIADLRDRGPGETELAEAVRYATAAATVGLSHPAALATAAATVLFGGDTLDVWRRHAAAAHRLTPTDVARSGAAYIGPEALIDIAAVPGGHPHG